MAYIRIQYSTKIKKWKAYADFLLKTLSPLSILFLCGLCFCHRSRRLFFQRLPIFCRFLLLIPASKCQINTSQRQESCYYSTRDRPILNPAGPQNTGNQRQYQADLKKQHRHFTVAHVSSFRRESRLSPFPFYF